MITTCEYIALFIVWFFPEKKPKLPRAEEVTRRRDLHVRESRVQSSLVSWPTHLAELREVRVPLLLRGGEQDPEIDHLPPAALL